MSLRQIDILLDIIEEAKLAGNIADHVDLETPLFSRTLRQLKSLVDDLESLQKECTKDNKKEKKDKPKKAKWLFIQGQISQLQAKTSNARANLQTALQIMTWRMAQFVLFCHEKTQSRSLLLLTLLQNTRESLATY